MAPKKSSRLGRVAGLAREALSVPLSWMRKASGSSSERREEPSVAAPRIQYDDDVSEVGSRRHAPEPPVQEPPRRRARETPSIAALELASRFTTMGERRFGVFSGKPDPWEATHWLESVTDTLNILGCPNDRRVKLTIYFFQGDAKAWFAGLEQTIGAARYDWDIFCGAFHNEYFLRTFRKTLRQEYVNLKQNGRSVDEYLADFQRLSAMFSTVTPTVEDRSEQFIRGLDPEIVRGTNSAPLKYFLAVVAMVRRTEQCEKAIDQKQRKGKAPAEEDVRMRPMRAAVRRGFARMDDLALTACACGKADLRPPPCGCKRSEIESNFVGSTAVVALVNGGRLVANCGDSRAVLSRGGQAMPLSADHKPDRADELARIKTAGGRVIDLNGARVAGMLAVSRALGDKYLKPYVISEPEIIVVERTAEDECLIIASDGLWDVLPNDLACDVACQSLQDADPTSSEDEDGDARCSLAAALLARLALARRSGDNISVVVVDLRKMEKRALVRLQMLLPFWRVDRFLWWVACNC